MPDLRVLVFRSHPSSFPSMSVVIQVDRLCKQCRLGRIGGKRLVDDVNRWSAKLRGKEDPLSKVGHRKGESRKQKAEMGQKDDRTTGRQDNKTSVSGQPKKSVVNGQWSRRPCDRIWALRDVSFEVNKAKSWALSDARAPARAPCSRSSPASPLPPPARSASKAPSPACSRVAPVFNGIDRTAIINDALAMSASATIEIGSAA